MKLARMSVATFNLYNLNEPRMPIYTDADGWSEEEYDGRLNGRRAISGR